MMFLIDISVKMVTITSLQLNTLVQVLKKWKYLDLLLPLEANNQFGNNDLHLLES